MYRIVEEPLSADAVARAVTVPEAGGVAVFLGVVRNQTAGRRVVALEYEAHVPMAEAKLKEIGEAVYGRWPGVRQVVILHRIGRLLVGEASVAIGVSAAHRQDAFEACQYAIDTVKQIVPIWKRELFEDGSAWVGPPGRIAAAGVERRRWPMTAESRPPSPSPLVAAVREAVAGRQRLLDPGDHVLVGVSGGPDSVALLHALVLLRSEYALRLTVCHVHHGLRPEADRDAAFVEALAARLGCPVRVVRVEVPRGGGRSPEEAARLARHAALARVARATGAGRIALGHTADDQVETVLMRILQGAGPRGLAGIPARRGRIVRPLLDVDRATVLAHLAAHGLEAVEDATNRDTKFLRNRVRHELLPLLAAQAGSRVPAALRRVARASREAVEALDALVRPRLAGHLTPDARGLAARPRRARRSPRRRGEGGGAPRPRGGRVGRPARRRAARGAPRRAGRAGRREGPGRGCGCPGASSSSAVEMRSGSSGRRRRSS